MRDKIKEDPDFIEKNKCDLCASLQTTIVDILMDKLYKAVKQTGIKHVAVAGGVSANSAVEQGLLLKIMPESMVGQFICRPSLLRPIMRLWWLLRVIINIWIKEFCDIAKAPFARVEL